MAAGAPKGNRNATKTRIWAEAINKVLCQADEGKKQKLVKLAEKLVASALEGDMSAIKEIGDRVDGKALAVIEVTGDIDVTNHAGLPEVDDIVEDLLQAETDSRPEAHTTH